MSEIERFFGCYCLVSRNEKYAGCTYIGFTNNPTRREGQHNKGKEAGGAWKTSGKGPWDMAIIVHGFPNEISALQFEWAWQNPEKSRHLRRRQEGSSKEKFPKCNVRTPFYRRLQVMIAMLNSAPWKRLPLTIRWLNERHETPFGGKIPLHMPICFGVVTVPKKQSGIECSQVLWTCNICEGSENTDSSCATCYWPDCYRKFHLSCLAIDLNQDEPRDKSSKLIPVSGKCRFCNNELLWGDIIRFKHGCYKALQNTNEES